MPPQPLQPFAPPTELLKHFNLPTSVSTGTLVVWALLAVFTVWILFTAVAVYHWLKYSHAARITFPAIGIHLGISFLLMMFILSGAL